MSKPPPKPPAMKGGPPPPPPGPKGGPPPPPPGPKGAPAAPKPKALLGSIEGFKKGGLKRVDKSEIRDNSAPLLTKEKKGPGGGGGGPMGMPMMLPSKKGAAVPAPSAGERPPMALPGMKKAAPGKPAPPLLKTPAVMSPMRGGAREADEAPLVAVARGPPGGKGVAMFPGGVPKPGGKPTPPLVSSAPKKAAPPIPSKPKAKAVGNSTISARAVYTYTAQRDDELSFNEGDTIMVLSKNADGWWEGECGGYRGVFPGNYVEEASAPAKKQVRSQWAYQAQRADELSFGEGETITVLEEKGNWHRGECNGRSGLYPANYVVSL